MSKKIAPKPATTPTGTTTYKAYKLNVSRKLSRPPENAMAATNTIQMTASKSSRLTDRNGLLPS